MNVDRASGRRLLRNRYLNKGTAFTAEERDRFGLHGLLPPVVETLAMQLERTGSSTTRRADDLDRHIFLRLLQQRSSVLFYRFLVDNIDELLPIMYTPTVGLACQRVVADLPTRARAVRVAGRSRPRRRDD